MLIDFIGWLGAGLILGAYYLISAKKASGDSYLYQLINLIGAIALIINAYYKGAIPFVALNIVWVAIAIRSLIKK